MIQSLANQNEMLLNGQPSTTRSTQNDHSRDKYQLDEGGREDLSELFCLLFIDCSSSS